MQEKKPEAPNNHSYVVEWQAEIYQPLRQESSTLLLEETLTAAAVEYENKQRA
jgi:hypothetical protein